MFFVGSGVPEPSGDVAAVLPAAAGVLIYLLRRLRRHSKLTLLSLLLCQGRGYVKLKVAEELLRPLVLSLESGESFTVVTRTLYQGGCQRVAVLAKHSQKRLHSLVRE